MAGWVIRWLKDPIFYLHSARLLHENTLLLSQDQQVVMRQTKRPTWFDLVSEKWKWTHAHVSVHRKRCIRRRREKHAHWNSRDGSAIHRKADFWIMEAQISLFFFGCNFTHLVAFLGHYCKTLPEVSNICYSYAWGIRLNMSYGKKKCCSPWHNCLPLHEREKRSAAWAGIHFPLYQM